ncbi:MAG: response regulator [Planctomycetota bacterium]|jgi:two-component system phosphate regulon response regulator PhoB
MTSHSAQILVLEDEPTQREILVYNLSHAGYRLAAAADAAKAIALARHQRFDLVVTDYYLPGQSGTDFVKMLRKMDEYRRVPIILLTARTEELNLEYLRKDLSVLVMSKPWSMKTLVETIATCLEAAPCGS